MNDNMFNYWTLAFTKMLSRFMKPIKYNKQYYEDRDLKPSENLLFTLTLYPLTTYEQSQNR